MGVDQLTALAARLRAIPTLGHAIAVEAAPSCQAIARETAAAGTTPDGAPWAPRKKDGGRALARVADSITASAIGDVIMLLLVGKGVYHNTKRRILPDRGVSLPQRYGEVIRAAAERAIGRGL